MLDDGRPERGRELASDGDRVALDHHVELRRAAAEQHIADRPADDPQPGMALADGEQRAPGLAARELVQHDERVMRGGRRTVGPRRGAVRRSRSRDR